MKKGNFLTALHQGLHDSVDLGAKSSKTEQVSDNVIIDAIGNYPAIGDSVMQGEQPAEDGKYAFETEEGNVSFSVKEGKIEEIEDKMVKKVSNGKVVTVNVPTVKRRLSAKQKAGLAKARQKANTPAAKRARLKSLAVGKLKGIYNSVEVDTSKVDMDSLGSHMYTKVFEVIADNFELSAAQLDSLDMELSDKVCIPEVDEKGQISFDVPVYPAQGDDIDLANYKLKSVTYDLEGAFDSDSMIMAIEDSSLDMKAIMFSDDEE